MEGFGYTRKQIRDGINKGELNHATATYNLLVMTWDTIKLLIKYIGY